MNIKNNYPIAILGNPDTGKTNLMVYLANESGHKNKYILGYPEQIKGFIQLSSMQDLAKISDCVLAIDELDELIPIYENKSNDSLRRLLKFTAHNNVKLIFTTQLSQFVNKMLQALVPQWAICQIDIFSLKNGSKPKRILLDYLKMPQIMNREIGMKLSVGKFVWFNDYAEAGENGVKEFSFQGIGKAWRNHEQNPEKKQEENVYIEINEITNSQKP